MESWWCLKGLKDKHVGIPAYKSSATVPWSQSVHPSIASSIASPWNTSPLHPIEIHHQMHLLQILNRYKCIPLKCIANTTHPKWNTLRSIQQRQLNMTNEKCQGGRWISELPALEMPFGGQFWGGQFWVHHSSELPALFIMFFCVDMTFNWFQMLFRVFCIVSVQDLYALEQFQSTCQQQQLRETQQQ